MESTYYISGMHCKKCIIKIDRALRKLAGVTSVVVKLPGNVSIESNEELSHDSIAAAIQSAGTYTLTVPQSLPMRIFTKAQPYFPLIIAFGSVVCWTIFRRVALGWDVHSAMCDFMGAFFLIFGGLKLISWSRFAENFRGYDPLAAKSRLYAYLYPVIEIYLGIGYQFGFQAEAGDEIIFNILTAFILSITSFGVVKALQNKQRIQCACLGGVFAIPITWFTVFENVIMIFMAIYMLIL